MKFSSLLYKINIHFGKTFINIIKHIPNLVDTIPIIISHHEKYDGNGYPRGISGENIPILGRVICIADAFDAMTSERTYRNVFTVERALTELKENSGSQFDPELVDIFCENFTKIINK